MVSKSEVIDLKTVLDELTYLFIELAAFWEYQTLLLEADIHELTSERSA